MPILSSIAGAAAKAYGMMANAKRIITDTFNRANGSLGTSSSGYLWSALRGTWSISSNQATSSDAGNTYPLATVDVGAQNVIVSADITDGGPGVAFWVTDANSWWASAVNYSTSSTFTGTTVVYQTGLGYWSGTLQPSGYYIDCSCGGFWDGELGCCQDGYGNCVCSGYYTTYSCTGPGGNPSSGGGNCGTYYPATFDSYCGSKVGSGDCNEITNYITELKVYKNVSGSITTETTQQLNSNTSAYSKVNSIKVTTNGEQITAIGYSNSGLSSQLGSSITLNASGANRGPKSGIIKTPSTLNAGNIIDNFSVENII